MSSARGHQFPARGPSGTSPRGPSPAGSQRSRFVGRSTELAGLVEALPERSPGVGTELRFLTGEPGIGKTRLAVELATIAAETGHRVVWSQVWQEASAPPFWPWTQVTRELADAPGAVDLGRVVLPDAGATDRFELFDATAGLVRRAAEREPLVIVLDDLHEADPPSVLLLHFVVAHLRTTPALIVATYRHHEVAARPDLAEPIAAMDRLSVTVHLGGLGVDDVGAMAADPIAGPHLHAATGGNPLFVEQVLRARTAGQEGDRAAGVEALRDVLVRRLDRLDPAARDVLAARAVLGPQGEDDDVAAVTGVPAGELDRLLHLTAEADLLDQDRRWFTHPLIADAALAAVPPERQQAMHLAAASRWPDRPETASDRAHHLAQAGPAHWPDAVAAYRAAAAYATEAFAYEDAVVHLLRARGIVEDHPVDPVLTFEVVFGLAGAVTTATGRSAAEDLYAEAWERALAIGDPVLLARAAARHTLEFFFSGSVAGTQAAQVRTALESLHDGAEAEAHLALRARLHATLGVNLVVAEPDLAARHAATAVSLARDSADPDAIGTALVAEQVTDLGPGTLTRRLDTARRIISLAESSGDRDQLVHGRFLLMAALVERGDVGELDAQLSTQHHVVDTIASPRFARHAQWFRATRAMLDGDHEEVLRLAADCHAIAVQLEDPDGDGVFWGQVGVARWMQGRVHEMEPAYLEQSRLEPDAAVWKAVLAWVRAEAGHLDTARGALALLPEPAELPSDQHTLLALVTMCEAAILVGDDERVASAWEAMLPYTDHVVPIAMGAATWGAVARAVGVAALHLGHVDEGIAHLEHAVAVCARLGARPWLVHAQLDLVEALCGHGRGEDPRVPALLAEASATVRDRNLAVFSERVTALEERIRTGADPERSRRAGAGPGSAADGPGHPDAAAAETGATPGDTTGVGVASDDAIAARPRVEVLGTFEVTATDGTSPRWTSRKARELLKILVGRRGAPVPREVVMDLLWPEEDPAVLGNRLSVALSTVRRSLDPDRSAPANSLVAADTTTIRLVVANVDVDAEEFLAAAERALDAHRSDAPDTPELLRAARAAYGGVALPDEPYAAWAESLRAEVQAAAAAVLRATADVAATAEDHLTVSEAHRGLLDLDLYDEGAHLGLVSALRALGAHGQADAAAARYRAAMEEIGVPVDPDV